MPGVIQELMVYHPETDYLVAGCTKESAAISEIRNSVRVTQCPEQRRVGQLRCSCYFNPWHTLNDEVWLHNGIFIFYLYALFKRNIRSTLWKIVIQFILLHLAL